MLAGLKSSRNSESESEFEFKFDRKLLNAKRETSRRPHEQCPILRKFARVFSVPTMKQGEEREEG